MYNSSENPDSSGMMWRCLESNQVMLGIEIDRYMRTFLNQRVHIGVGSNPNTTLKIAKRYYKDHVGKLDHYYRLNDVSYSIARVCNKIIPSVGKSRKTLEYVPDADELKKLLLEERLKTYTPYKDFAYIEHRYMEHPVYQYDIWNIADAAVRTNSVLITRKVWHKDSNVIKIIDFIGEGQDLKGLAEAFDLLMAQDNSEYIDIYSYGLSDRLLRSMGMLRLEEDDANIIPNYFEPFEQRNVDIYYVASSLENLHLYRGDADQDRPNFIDNKV
ncbi:MAG: hypothetical protein K2N94_02410 [Lachnospiraceae bacterium]|nr:hypothetical protein [Lachnospiraceae bacterium]